MPKGEIVGIKLVLPLVTTLSNITDSTELRVMQCLPGYAVSTGLCSVYRVLQCSPSTIQNIVFTEYSSEYSVHRVQYRMQYSPSHQSGTVLTEEQCLPRNSVYRVTRQEHCLPRNSVYRVNLLYRVSSGYRVQNYSRRLVWTVSSLLPSAWRCRVTQWTPSIRRSPS